MIQRAYSIFDNKGLIYASPFFAPTNGAAVRMVQDVANDLNTSIGRHPSDYILYCIGDYNDANGVLNAYAPLEHVIDVISLVTLKPQGSLFADLSKATAEEVNKLRANNGAL